MRLPDWHYPRGPVVSAFTMNEIETQAVVACLGRWPTYRSMVLRHPQRADGALQPVLQIRLYGEASEFGYYVFPGGEIRTEAGGIPTWLPSGQIAA